MFFFNDAATTEISTLSLHDALPISHDQLPVHDECPLVLKPAPPAVIGKPDEVRWGAQYGCTEQESDQSPHTERSEEHTSELQSRQYLVCRLLLEKKKN